MEHFDFAMLDTRPQAEAGVEVQLYNFDTREPLPVYFTVCGVDSKVYQDAFNAQMRRRLAAKQKAGNVQLTPEEILSDEIDLLVACTKGWRGVRFHGQELPFSAKACREFYQNFQWAREQVDRAIHDRANFLPPSSSSSSPGPSTSSAST